MSGRLEGKVAVITGAGSGVGRATAALFHAEAAKVLAVDVSGHERELTAQLGDGALAMSVDVSAREQVEAMIEAAVASFQQLDVLVNCAGIDGQPAPLADSTDENFEHVLV